MLKLLFKIVPFLIVSICLHFAVPQQVDAGADSALFKKGVAAFQSNRYPDAIGTFSSLLNGYPGSPLKDMTIYYLARAHLKSGHRHQAAELTARLLREYPASYNRNTIDAELLKVINDQEGNKTAAGRPETGAVPAKSASITSRPKPSAVVPPPLPVKVLATPAREPQKKLLKQPRPLRQAQMSPQPPVVRKKPAAAQSPVVSAQKPKPPRARDNRPAKASPERFVPPAAPTPVVHEERTMAVEQYAAVVGKGAAPLEMGISPGWVAIKAGSTVSIPFTLSNRDAAAHSLRLSCDFPPYFLPRFRTVEGGPIQNEVTVPPGATYRGVLTLAMPTGAADGARFSYQIFAHSISDKNLSISGEAGIIASAEGERH